MNLKPTKNQVVLKPIPLALRAESGLHLPETFTERSAFRQYSVEAVGPKVNKDLQPGMTVLAPFHLEIVVNAKDGTLVCDAGQIIGLVEA